MIDLGKPFLIELRLHRDTEQIHSSIAEKIDWQQLGPPIFSRLDTPLMSQLYWQLDSRIYSRLKAPLYSEMRNVIKHLVGGELIFLDKKFSEPI